LAAGSSLMAEAQGHDMTSCTAMDMEILKFIEGTVGYILCASSVGLFLWWVTRQARR